MLGDIFSFKELEDEGDEMNSYLMGPQFMRNKVRREQRTFSSYLPERMVNIFEKILQFGKECKQAREDHSAFLQSKDAKSTLFNEQDHPIHYKFVQYFQRHQIGEGDCPVDKRDVMLLFHPDKANQYEFTEDQKEEAQIQCRFMKAFLICR